VRRVSTTIALVALALAVPAGAQAQDNSALDEYLETIPGAGGDNPSSGQDGGSGGGGDPLPAETSASLESQGPAGAAAAAVAEATAPERRGGAGGSGERERRGSEDGGSGGGGGLPAVDEVVDNVAGGSDSDGLGIVFPIVLGAALLAAIAFVLIRRRGGPGEPTQA
jgi:hypothetical protein